MTTTPASLPPPRPSRRNLHPNLRRNRPPLAAGALALLLAAWPFPLFGDELADGAGRLGEGA